MKREIVKGIVLFLVGTVLFTSHPAYARRIKDFNSQRLAEIISKLRSDINTVDWSGVDLATQKLFLEWFAVQLEKDIRDVTSDDYCDHHDFLNNHTISGFYMYYYKLCAELDYDFGRLPQELVGIINLEDTQLSTPEFIRKIFGFGERVKDLEYVIRLVKSNGHVEWSQVPLSVQKEMLYWLSENAKVDIYRIDSEIYCNPQSFLGGNALNGFYKHYDSLRTELIGNFGNLPSRFKNNIKEEDLELTTSVFIRKALGIPDISADKVVEFINAGYMINWPDIPLSTQKGVLEYIGSCLGKDVTDLNSEDFRNKHNFLSGHTLSGFYYYYQRLRSDLKKDFNSLPGKFKSIIKEQDLRLALIPFIMRTLDINTAYKNLDDIIRRLSNPRGKSDFSWARVSLDNLREIFDKAFNELVKKGEIVESESSSSNNIMYYYSYDFLNQKSLSSLFVYYDRLFHKARADYSLLPYELTKYVSAAELDALTTKELLFRVWHKTHAGENIEERSSAEDETDLTDYSVYTDEERVWITNLTGLNGSRWEDTSLRQRAFYLTELAVYLGITDIRDLEIAGGYRIFEIIVPVFGRALYGLYSYYQSIYSIIKELSETGMIEEINNKLSERAAIQE